MSAIGSRYLLVEMQNHAHLSAVYGEAFAADAVRTLQWQAHLWGGSVTTIDRARFLVTLVPDRSAGASPQTGRDLPSLERCQLELAAVPMIFAGHRARPVVTVDPVQHGNLAPADAHSQCPEALERAGTSVLALASPRLGRSVSMDYTRDMALAVAFDQALVQGRVNLAFQPIMRYDQSGAMLYAEGLLRVSGLPGRAGAGQIVPALERLGLVRALDRAVVLAVMDRLETEGDLRLGCNVSACSLVADSWWLSILDRLAAKPDMAARLTLEITETAPLTDMDVAVGFVHRLKALGCQIALDDFGTGHSSLAFARAAQPDVIKLAAEELRRAHRSAEDQRVFLQLVALCRALAPQVVVEGVEDTVDVRMSFEAGVNWLQGMLIAPPLACRPQVSLVGDTSLREGNAST